MDLTLTRPESKIDSSREEMPLVLANAKIVLPENVLHGAVVVQNGRIASIDSGPSVPAGAIDLEGDFLLPGLVELHTDNLERHLQPRPTVRLPDLTAILAHDGELASCGITTVFDALRVGSETGADARYGEYARNVASEILALHNSSMLKLRHMLHLRAEVCSDTLIEELNRFHPEDRVRLISVMDHTPGQRQFRDVQKYKDYMVGKYSVTDEMFDDHVARKVARGNEMRADHENAALAAAERLGATLASHDDTTHEHVTKSKGQGINLAEFPTTVEAAEACRDHGIRIIMGAPNILRGGSHSGNVSALDLAERDLLDVISSDYVPSALLYAGFKLAHLWDDLPRAVRTISTNPADATGLSDRGRIAPEALGDLVRVRTLNDVPVVRGVWRGGVQIS